MKQPVTCPECHAEVAVSVEIQKGEVITCPDCGVDLEVTGIDPLEVKKAPETQEDWGQ